ncbi:hypothetical protein WG219_08750 [Ectopseudomonas mendocina]|uniref:HIG1 domain-containing protein n=1 Tax=Ectopseudomonas mendocina TaxID=300 RepID=A0ABZ2RKK3_ECTME
MKKIIGISALILLALSIFSAVLWLGGIAGAVTGGGRNTNEIDYLMTLAKVLFVLAALSGVVALAWPGQESGSANESSR